MPHPSGVIGRTAMLVGLTADCADQRKRQALAGILTGLICLSLSLGTFHVAAAESSPTKRVLMLFSEAKDLPTNMTVERAAKEELSAHSTNRIEFYTEYLDASRFPGESYFKLFREYLREKYVSRPPDLIMAFLARGFGLAGELPAVVFPEVPVVFVSANELEMPESFHLPRSTGIIQRHDFRGTFDLILAVQPQTRRIVVIGGVAPMDQEFIHRAEKVSLSFSDRVQFEFWTNHPVAELHRLVASLPPGTVVCLSTVLRDAAGHNFFPEQVAESLAPVASVPIYVLAETLFGTGAVGGALVDFDGLGRRAGEFGLRILSGTPAADLPVEIRAKGALVFDWRALSRWHLNPRMLPAGSIVRFRPTSLWQDHRGLILGTAGVIFAQVVTIAALLANRARRRRSEEQLRESETRMNLAADAANLGLWVWDVAQDEIWATAKCRALFEFGPEERVSFARFAERVHPDDRSAMEQTVRGALEKRTSYDAEYRACLPGGGMRWIGARGVAAGNVVGSATRMLGVCLDLTAKKRAEEEIQRQRGEIAHVSRVSTMGELAASVAHELNQPLGAILSNAEAAEILLSRTPPALDDLREILSDIRKDDERAGEVIRRMRSLLRKRELEHKPIDLNAMVGDVLRLLSADAALRKTALTAELAPGLPPAEGDRIHLQQVLINLILNGFEAMAALPAERRRLLVRTDRNETGALVVAVIDCGVGIDADKLPHLFEPFFTTKQDGMGMGLSIARTIIEAHHGRISAENNPGGGATFRFLLWPEKGGGKP